MTYGWALLLIALVAAAIVSLGILDTGSFVGSRALGFSQVAPIGWSLDQSGSFRIMLKNNAGTDINVTSIRASYGSSELPYSSNVVIPNGMESGEIGVGTFFPGKPGESYTIRLNINYTDSETGFPYTDSGTLTGRVV
jgi:hypothetical protein